MLYSKPCPEGTSMRPQRYVFLEPVRLRIEKDGRTSLWGYGIGDYVDVLEPTCQYCVLGKRLSRIPLSDGSFIVEPPLHIRMSYGKQDNSN